jgi:glycosyltransferase involved in cell wall biosynthesis
VIPSLVDLAADQPDPAARDIDALWVSNIRAFKRPDLALQLAERLPDVRLHMIGGTQPGEEAYFEAIRARAAGLPNVTFHGPLSYQEVNAYMSRARVLVNTSDAEGFPNTYLQAWSRGTPVIAFFDPDGVIAGEGLGRAVHGLEEMIGALRELLPIGDAWHSASRRCSRYVSVRHGRAALQAYVEALIELGTSDPANRSRRLEEAT